MLPTVSASWRFKMFIGILKALRNITVEKVFDSVEPRSFQINLLIESFFPPTNLFVSSHANISSFRGHWLSQFHHADMFVCPSERKSCSGFFCVESSSDACHASSLLPHLCHPSNILTLISGRMLPLPATIRHHALKRECC